MSVSWMKQKSSQEWPLHCVLDATPSRCPDVVPAACATCVASVYSCVNGYLNVSQGDPIQRRPITMLTRPRGSRYEGDPPRSWPQPDCRFGSDGGAHGM